jgi:hypothetical protein
MFRLILLLVLFLTACRPPLSPTLPAPTPTPETQSGLDACACLQTHAADIASDIDMARILAAIQVCFTLDKTAGDDADYALAGADLARQAECLPFDFGRDLRNDTLIEVFYWCEDVCPAYGKVEFRYKDIDAERCVAMGGALQFSFFQDYVGCFPVGGE